MFFNPSIKNRVMAVMKQRIADAQADFDEGARRLDETCEEQIQLSERVCADKKEALANELVTSILGR